MPLNPPKFYTLDFKYTKKALCLCALKNTQEIKHTVVVPRKKVKELMFEEEEVKGWSDRKSLGTTDLHPTRWVGFVTEESATDSRKFRQSQSCFSVLLLRRFLLAAPTKSTLFVNFVWLRPDEHLLNTAKLCKSLSTWKKCIMLVKRRNSAHCWTAEERFTARGKVMCHHDAAPDWSQGFLLDLRETKLQLWKVVLHFFPACLTCKRLQ